MGKTLRTDKFPEHEHSERLRSKQLPEQGYLGLAVTKPVFGVSEKAGFKPVSSATETS